MPKPCDACQTSSAVLYCRADAAFLCAGCDVKVHGANKLARRHERVWVCHVCELAPAVVTCKADAAALCVACDTDIHSANRLAKRHERTPVTPFFEFPGAQALAAKKGGGGGAFGVPQRRPSGGGGEDAGEDEHSVAEEAASWLLPNPRPLDEDGRSAPGEFGNHDDGSGSSFLAAVGGFSAASALDENGMPKMAKAFKSEMNNGGDLFTDLDPYLDLDYATAIASDPPARGNDSLVPIHRSDSRATQSTSTTLSTGSASFDEEVVCNDGYSYGTHSLSSSSLDVGIVPDSSASDISTSYVEALPQGSFEFAPQMMTMAQADPPMAREARVLRYQEKRKNRKFEKTIRYASRKAYAESRPRIKGRFAKRNTAELGGLTEVYPTATDAGFGVVPAF